MPILNLQMTAAGKAPDGKKIAVPPPRVLETRGPVLQATVGLSETAAEALLQKGDKVPDPISGWALLDTGASRTCVDEAAANQLSLPAIDTVRVASASHRGSKHNLYPIHVALTGSGVEMDAQAIGCPIAGQKLLLLLGRDLLQHGVFIYNGMTGSISLALG